MKYSLFKMFQGSDESHFSIIILPNSIALKVKAKIYASMDGQLGGAWRAPSLQFTRDSIIKVLKSINHISNVKRVERTGTLARITCVPTVI